VKQVYLFPESILKPYIDSRNQWDFGDGYIRYCI